MRERRVSARRLLAAPLLTGALVLAACGGGGGTNPGSEESQSIAPMSSLDINAQDVAHSWWIPKLGGKMDAIPGYTNHTWFKVPAKMAVQQALREAESGML